MSAARRQKRTTQDVCGSQKQFTGLDRLPAANQQDNEGVLEEIRVDRDRGGRKYRTGFPVM